VVAPFAEIQHCSKAIFAMIDFIPTTGGNLEFRQYGGPAEIGSVRRVLTSTANLMGSRHCGSSVSGRFRKVHSLSALPWKTPISHRKRLSNRLETRSGNN